FHLLPSHSIKHDETTLKSTFNFYKTLSNFYLIQMGFYSVYSYDNNELLITVTKTNNIVSYLHVLKFT
ncbi:hypothetical protein RhiirC2_730905, partial [Rhizophagus irregularis]